MWDENTGASQSHTWACVKSSHEYQGLYGGYFGVSGLSLLVKFGLPQKYYDLFFVVTPQEVVSLAKAASLEKGGGTPAGRVRKSKERILVTPTPKL